ncbi:MAG TPA: siroheme synthase CysG [Burkholderiales bacterium]|jgi:uroporphyrin-III C-methyltransferase/precorrin-2 dehydrogenase/sirohydrochlorin ferrochelatase|nr:siroheme synthase CysG [Burkholderiales bacterium]
MDFLPIFLDVRAQPCLVVGGGEAAARKCALLLRAGARVTVLAPELGATLRAELAAGRIVQRAAVFRDADLDGFAVAIAATSDDAVNRAVAAAAKARRIPVNVVDQPALCSFILPSIIERAPLTVAVSSGGASPVLARLLRARLESLIPAGYGRLAALAGAFRDRVKARFKPQERRRFWERVLQGPIAELVFSGRDADARKALQAALEDTRLAFSSGEVSLIGAGPGDPDLLTFRALRLMQQADVVVYDRLVSQPILDLVRLEAERIYAGKERAKHTLPQEDINHLLVRLAREGKRVVRLKGGDPFIFGRGGEEIDTLAAEGIPFQVVPGITAAAGCASYAGIPLTHRDFAQSVVFVTGHLKNGSMDLNWKALAQPRQTIVFYMGLVGVEVLCRELTEHGLPAATPAALVQAGTTPQQRVLTGTLESLPGLVRDSGVKAPTLIIIGEVVTLRERLKWFEPAA